MAPVPAIADMVADPRSVVDEDCDPVGETQTPIATGPHLSDSREEDRHGCRTPDRTESETAKGISPSTPGRGPRSGGDASPRRRDRRRQPRALRRGPAGSGPPLGPPV